MTDEGGEEKAGAPEELDKAASSTFDKELTDGFKDLLGKAKKQQDELDGLTGALWGAWSFVQSLLPGQRTEEKDEKFTEWYACEVSAAFQAANMEGKHFKVYTKKEEFDKAQNAYFEALRNIVRDSAQSHEEESIGQAMVRMMASAVTTVWNHLTKPALKRPLFIDDVKRVTAVTVGKMLIEEKTKEALTTFFGSDLLMDGTQVTELVARCTNKTLHAQMNEAAGHYENVKKNASTRVWQLQDAGKYALAGAAGGAIANKGLDFFFG